MTQQPSGAYEVGSVTAYGCKTSVSKLLISGPSPLRGIFSLPLSFRSEAVILLGSVVLSLSGSNQQVATEGPREREAQASGA